MNKTQCPHCLKVYVISDEQYEASDGIVSCGACHEEFFATFIDDISSAGDGESEEIQLLGPNYGFDESLNSEISIRFDEDDSEVIIDDKDFDRRPSFSPSQHSVKLPQQEPLVLTELAEDADQEHSENTIIPEDDIQLIQAVDQLIDDKIISSSVASEVADQIEDISTNEIDNESEHHSEEKFKIRREKGSLLKTYLLTPIFLILLSILGIMLLYQLWLKQIIFWPDNAAVRNIIEPVATPIRQKFEDYNVVFPDRRNLNGLQLLAADVEAHASRASTILLRVSLINRAKISQALPTLELTLTDADGRLVSRRSLNPEDYLYNNRTANTIGSNELKKVTIELLAFPKQATGYELRILGEETK